VTLSHFSAAVWTGYNEDIARCGVVRCTGRDKDRHRGPN